MNINEHKWIWFLIGCSLLTLMLSGCSGLKVIDRTSNSVMDEGMPQSTGELKDELEGFIEQEEIFEMTVLEEQLYTGLKDLLGQKLKKILQQEAHVDDIDLRLYKQTVGEPYVFTSMWFDQEQMPHLFIGFVILGENGEFNVTQLYAGTIFVNMPKTSLQIKGDQLAIISQRPFSTYEEYFIFNIEKEIELVNVLWSDRSVSYYKELERYMLEGDFESAMSLEDVSEYPMTYEKEMFHAGGVVFNESIRLGERAGSKDLKTQFKAYQWGLDYYFMMHYALTVDELIEEDFKPLVGEKTEDFGARYALDNTQIKKGLLIYADLLAKMGNEKAAEALRGKIEKLL